MRIAQLTFNSYSNYGSLLQKYALHQTLKKFANVVEVLWNSNTDFLPETGNDSFYQIVLPHINNNRMLIYYMREAIRQSKFKDFENLHIKTRFNFPYLEDIGDDYDYFVVGSDNLWNLNSVSMRYFLDFVPRAKKITYAVSVIPPVSPMSEISKYLFRKGVSSFAHLSIREERNAKLVEEITGIKPLAVPDPVLLLTPNEWRTISQKPTWFNEKYQRGFVLTYYLRKSPPPHTVKTLAAELDLPVINLLDIENYNHFTVGPAEFVWLFDHASLVLGNSFHCLVFCILFRRPFINRVFKDDQQGINGSYRALSLLKTFGLEDRRTFGEKIFTAKKAMTIDFSRRDEVLPIERTRAFNFLSTALLSGGDAK